MKKFIVFFVFLLVGCSNNKLKCEKSIKSNGYVSKEVYTLEYSKDDLNLKYISFVTEYNFNELYSLDEVNEQYESVVKSCDTFKEDSNNKINCETNIDGRNIKVIITTNLDEIDKDVFENIMYVPLDELNNKSNTKKLFKNVGYNCN